MPYDLRYGRDFGTVALGKEVCFDAGRSGDFGGFGIRDFGYGHKDTKKSDRRPNRGFGALWN